jgi:hypothetical protein
MSRLPITAATTYTLTCAKPNTHQIRHRQHPRHPPRTLAHQANAGARRPRRANITRGSRAEPRRRKGVIWRPSARAKAYRRAATTATTSGHRRLSHRKTKPRSNSSASKIRDALRIQSARTRHPIYVHPASKIRALSHVAFAVCTPHGASPTRKAPKNFHINTNRQPHRPTSKPIRALPPAGIPATMPW